MKDDFKIGDKIQVVRSAGSYLEQGAIYTAHEIYLKGGCTYVSLYPDGRKNRDGWDIDRFVKYEEKESTLKIEIGKKYRMIDTHEPVRIICVDRVTEDDFAPIVGLVKRQDGLEAMIYLDSEGHKLFTKDKLIEEIPEVDWSKVEVDTLIWVNGIPRYFYSAGKYLVTYFPDGCTSKTNTQSIMSAYKAVCSLEEPK